MSGCPRKSPPEVPIGWELQQEEVHARGKSAALEAGGQRGLRGWQAARRVTVPLLGVAAIGWLGAEGPGLLLQYRLSRCLPGRLHQELLGGLHGRLLGGLYGFAKSQLREIHSVALRTQEQAAMVLRQQLEARQQKGVAVLREVGVTEFGSGRAWWQGVHGLKRRELLRWPL